MTRLICGILFLFGWLCALFAQTPQPPAMSVQSVAANLFFVKGGSGANTAFYVTQSAVISIDAKMTTEAGRQMAAEIAGISGKPLETLIISHSDSDHVNGLSGFPKGLTIISSPGTAQEMTDAFKDDKLAGLRAWLPTRTYAGSSELRGVRPDGTSFVVSLQLYGPAHTSGDTVILFHGERVAFIGDLAFVGRDPLVHRHKGGTAAGYIGSLKKLIDLPVDTYLSGHADPLTRGDLRALLASMEEKSARVTALVRQGKTLDEVKLALGVPPAAGSRPSLIEVMYLESR